MKPIVTLTLNPAIDGASEVQTVRPTHKMRTSNERYDPGGGGINVARVARELGAEAVAVYLSGGETGAILARLLETRGLATRPVPIAEQTRIAHAVFERTSGLEYRFVPEGPHVTEAEWQACLAAIEDLDCDYLVASGSPPRGLRPDCYGDLARRAADRGVRVVLDTSGPALSAALEAGGLHLVKPSAGEFAAFAGIDPEDEAALAAAAEALVARGATRMIAVTLGHRGAILAHSGGVALLRPPEVPVRSAVGAGDSFVGAMTFALSRGRDPVDAFTFGIAAGTAAVMSPGTDLCRAPDVLGLYATLKAGEPAS